MAGILFAIAAWQAILICLLFAIMYVSSLYLWSEKMPVDRDDPDVIKHRFLSVSVICVLVPLLLWCFSTSSSSNQAYSVLEWVGVRFRGLVPAAVFPLLLTMVLFLCPLYLRYKDGVFRLYLEPRYWKMSIQNYVWVRNHIVAPVSEELVFRAAMLPVLVPVFGSSWSVVLCPLFFGVAHFHHMIEKVVYRQADVSHVLRQTALQFGYTTVFGAYCAYLFIRTGHLAAPVIAHAFCNHMGFPAFDEVLSYPAPVRSQLILLLFVGLFLWMILLLPLTSPFIYASYVYQA